jgi:hypothetical protein
MLTTVFECVYSIENYMRGTPQKDGNTTITWCTLNININFYYINIIFKRDETQWSEII